MLTKKAVNADGNIVMRRTQRRSKDTPRAPALELEKVLGFTAVRNTGLSVHPNKDILVYPAGCTAVLLDWNRRKQGPFLLASPDTASSELSQNNSASQSVASTPNGVGPTRPKSGRTTLPGSTFSPPKAIVSTAFSPDGRYVAVGEAGRLPRVLVWDLESEKYIVELKGHKFGILALAFSPDMKHLVSLGYQHDGVLNVWNWRTATRVASNRISSKVNALAFSSDGSFCVTVGLRHVRFWYFNHSEAKGLAVKTPVKTRVLEGRSGVLGNLSSKHFLDVACNDKDNSVYVLTTDGQLCMFNEGRTVEKCIDLKTSSGISLSLSLGKLACGCSDGITRIFTASPMKYVCTLPRPHPLGTDVSTQTGEIYRVSNDPQSQYADTIAVRFNFDGTKVINLFSDRSIYIWDVSELTRVSKVYSAIYHSDSIWDSQFLPDSNSNQLVTCSSDGTIKMWDVYNNHVHGSVPNSRPNIYSEELTKVIHLEQEAGLRYQRPAILPTESMADTPSRTSTDSTQGIRCVKFTPDGKYMVSGDRRGNLRVHDATSFELVTYQEAHDAEIMAIDALTLQSDDVVSYSIASASRDRLIHVFALSPGKFRLMQTLDDHSSSITSVSFFDRGSRLISCGADKSIIFRNSLDSVGLPYYTSYHNHCGRATFYAMAPDHSNNTLTAVALDKRIHQFSTVSGKLIQTIKLDAIDVSMTRVALDSSGQFGCVAGTDKLIRIVDLASGQILGSGSGHSEMVTSVNFSPDCSRVVTTSGDGCVYIWKIKPTLALQMRSRLYKLTRAMPALIACQPESNPVVDSSDRVNHLNTNLADLHLDNHLVGSLLRRPRRPRANSIDVCHFNGTKLAFEDNTKLPFPNVEFTAKMACSNQTNTNNLKLISRSPSPKSTTMPVVSPLESNFPEELSNSIYNLSNTISPPPSPNSDESSSVDLVDDTVPSEEDSASDGEESRQEKVFEDYLNQPLVNDHSKHRRSLSSRFKSFLVIKKSFRSRKAIPDAFPTSDPPISPQMSPTPSQIQVIKDVLAPFSSIRKSRSTLVLKHSPQPRNQNVVYFPKDNDNRVESRPVRDINNVRPLSSHIDSFSPRSNHFVQSPVFQNTPLSVLHSEPQESDLNLPETLSSPEIVSSKPFDESHLGLDLGPISENASLSLSQLKNTISQNENQEPEIARLKQTLQITDKLVDELSESSLTLGLDHVSDDDSDPRADLRLRICDLHAKLSKLVAYINASLPSEVEPPVPTKDSLDYAHNLADKYSEILIDAVLMKIGALPEKNRD